jgi:hypothetical protein
LFEAKGLRTKGSREILSLLIGGVKAKPTLGGGGGWVGFFKKFVREGDSAILCWVVIKNYNKFLWNIKLVLKVDNSLFFKKNII